MNLKNNYLIIILISYLTRYKLFIMYKLLLLISILNLSLHFNICNCNITNNSLYNYNFELNNINNKSNDNCDWTFENPKIKDTITICHNHLMILYDIKSKFPFASYSVYNPIEMQHLEGGRKNFIYDPSIDINYQHSPTDDVWKSPYSRGHLTPSNIMSYDKTPNGAWEETYYISNILPQLIRLNEIGWEHFESNITQLLSKQKHNTIWEIYTGGYWINDDRTQPPDYFWKAFCNRDECSSAAIFATHEDDPKWFIEPVSTKLPELFIKCCNNEIGNEWFDFYNELYSYIYYQNENEDIFDILNYIIE